MRAYAKVDNVMYYSSYTKLTAATYPGGKKAVTQAAAKLYKKSTAKGTVLATIPKNARLTYLGKTFCTDTKQTFHVKYTKSGKTYTGYLRSAAKLTF
ncbi:MAG: hypothetical protein LUH14_07165 [Clostridiaceae bacterium]|nr:hypothetical protein [Clostridiaceae bacterium]